MAVIFLAFDIPRGGWTHVRFDTVINRPTSSSGAARFVVNVFTDRQREDNWINIVQYYPQTPRYIAQYYNYTVTNVKY